MASSKSERTRLLVLVGILVVVGISAAVNYLSRQGGVGEIKRGEELSHTSHGLSSLEMDSIGSRDEVGDRSRRNPFTFGKPPTPTPNLTPRATPAPRATLPPRPQAPTPTPRDDGLPPPRPFDRIYIGSFGPERLPVAVFRNGDEIEVAVPGDMLDDYFIVRRVGYESVEIGYKGYYKEEDKTSVPLAEN
jgi:hypothetical protein